MKMDKAYCIKDFELPNGILYKKGKIYNIEYTEFSLSDGEYTYIIKSEMSYNGSFTEKRHDKLLFFYEYFKTLEEIRKKKIKSILDE